MPSAGIVICGAGVLGLTIARELVARGADEILILEKEERLGAHASGRNSGVLHAGIYYAPGSARARTCLEGNRLMRAYCAERGLPLAGSGKVIVAPDPAQLPALEDLHRRALANGSPVALLDEKELAELEPHARTAGRALHSPLTAVVDPRAVLAQIARELTASGKVRILTGCRVAGPAGPGALATSQGRVGYARLLNCAGAHADTLAHAFGLGRRFAMVPFKGCYRRLRPGRAGLVRGSIYPVPDPRTPFLGVHFTRGVAGDVSIGPTATPALGRENYGLLRGLDAEAPRILLRGARMLLGNAQFRALAREELRKYLPRHFFADCARLVRGLTPQDLEPSPKVGIRPQLVDTATQAMVMDFLVESDGPTVHVLNAISPAFTSSMAFARMLCDGHFAA